MEATLSTITHIETLQYRRENIKKAIKNEMKSPCCDELKLHALKKYNLRLKDELLAIYNRKAG
jgi:hypothetical protein